MSTRSILCFGLIVGFGLIVLPQAGAQTPLGAAFTYQGQLKNAGSPANGLHDLRFRLYGASVGGELIGTVLCIDNVSVADGLFTVPLDFGAQFAGEERFLEIDVRADTGLGCGNGAGFVTLSPRQALTAAPNTLFASNADLLDGLNSTAFLQSIPVPLTLSGINPTHIIRGDNGSSDDHATGVYGAVTDGTAITNGVYGLSASQYGRGVSGVATATNGFTFGGRFQSVSTSGLGVYGFASAATGSTYGVYGESYSTDGRGVFGLATAGSGVAYGVYGQSSSSAGVGVRGAATAATTGLTVGVFGVSNSEGGRGVYGSTTAATGANYGVYGQSLNSTGVYGSGGGIGVHGNGYDGVKGEANGSDGYGVWGFASGTQGRGVYGVASAGTGVTYGVYGLSNSSFENASGVYDIATAGTGITYGGRFDSNSTSGRAVSGYAGAASGPTYGVLGQSVSPSGYGVYCGGRFAATGTKAFRIDLPDDPANKYLLRYAAESPEVINFYRGTVVLDGAGEAMVELPHYFGKINKTPSYMLTAVGAPMPMLHVAEKISEAALSAGAKAEPGDTAPMCFFRIAGGAPEGEVSWEVKAARNDRWIQKRGAPVEVEKQDLEMGTYQHPELYGQPPKMGMNYDAERRVASGR